MCWNVTQADLLDRIVEAGREPIERDSLYNIVADTPALLAVG